MTMNLPLAETLDVRALVNYDFEDADPEDWSVFFVNQTEGHYFHKVVVIHQGTHGYGKRGYTSRGWMFEGSISPRTAQKSGQKPNPKRKEKTALSSVKT